MQEDDKPRENYIPAEIGDYAIVQVRESEWVLGEVTSITKEHKRVKQLLHHERGSIKVGPRHEIRLAKQRKLNKQRAFHLWMHAPESFPTWEEAREYFEEAKLREGEEDSSWDETLVAPKGTHQQQEESP
jgi:hypothetical protein